MSNHSRRDLLRFAAFGAASAGLSSLQPLRALCGRAIPNPAGNKVLVLYLRGAMDGIYTVAPVGDATYPTARAGVLTPVHATNPIVLDPGTGFAQLSEHFRILARSGGPIANGHMHFAMQVGNPTGKRSHFTEQQISETAVTPTGFALEKEGVMARLAQKAGFDAKLPLATVGSRLQRMFTSPLTPAAHVKSLDQYDVAHEDAFYDVIGPTLQPTFLDISAPMAGYAAAVRQGMTSHYKDPAGVPLAGPAQDVDKIGEFVLDSEAEVQKVFNPAPPLQPFQHDGALFPTSSAEVVGLPSYGPGFGIMRQCEEALALLELTPCSVAGVDIGGWDTHVNQAGQRALTDPWLAKAMHSLYLRTLSAPCPITVLVVTEFGRTNFANQGLSTDHGVGCLWMMFGPKVVYGLSNMTAASFPPMTTTSPNPDWKNALEVKTDFRTIYKELFRKQFLLSPTDLDLVVPPFTATAQQLTELNIFLP